MLLFVMQTTGKSLTINRTGRKALLCGNKICSLEVSFLELREKVIAEQPEKLLVLTGGSDPYHVSELILNCIDLYKFRNIDVICGMYNTDYRRLVKHYKNM